EFEVLEKRSRSPSRWRRRLLIGIPLILGLLVGQFFFAVYWAGRQLAETLAQLDQMDAGWRMEGLEASRKAVPDDENSAVRALAAYALFPHGWPLYPARAELTLEQICNDVPAPRLLSPEHLKFATAMMETAAAAVTEARTLADMPRGRHTIVYKDNTIAILLPHLQPMRELGTVMLYDAMLRAQQGDVDGALESCRAAVNAGRTVGEEP